MCSKNPCSINPCSINPCSINPCSINPCSNYGRSRRVFANKVDLNYSEYINRLKAEAIFKNVMYNNSKIHKIIGDNTVLNLQNKYVDCYVKYSDNCVKNCCCCCDSGVSKSPCDEPITNQLNKTQPEDTPTTTPTPQPLLNLNRYNTKFTIINYRIRFNKYKNLLDPNI